MTMSRQTEHQDEIVARALNDLPTPTSSEDFFVRLRLALEEKEAPSTVVPNAWRSGVRVRQRRTLVRAAVLVVVAVAAAAAGALGATLAGAAQTDTPDFVSAWSPIISFQPAEGWNTIETGVGSEETPRVAWAANVPFEPEESFGGFPDNTVRNLPPSGIVIVAVEPRVYEGGVAFPERELPLTLADGYFRSEHYEGQPAPHVSMFVIDALIDGRLLNVLVWMGTTQPSDPMINAADEELARLTIPRP